MEIFKSLICGCETEIHTCASPKLLSMCEGNPETAIGKSICILLFGIDAGKFPVQLNVCAFRTEQEIIQVKSNGAKFFI